MDADSARQLPTARPRLGELAVRVCSALVLAPLAVGTAFLGGWLFVGFWAIAALAVFWEWTTLAAGPSRHMLLLTGAGAIMIAALLLAVGEPSAAVGVIVAAMFPVAVVAPAGRRLWAVAGVAYAGAVALAPPVLRSDSGDGLVAMLFIFAVVWSTDIAAYFAGRTIGGPKLLPRISPKKTWSGAVGGMLAAVCVGVAFVEATNVTPALTAAFLAVLLSAAAQAGDLLESFVKRRFGAKDAGHLIPGHGGVMDRVDSFVSACVVAALLGLTRGGLEAPGRGLLLW